MSHLTTIINRVEARLSVQKFEDCIKDGFFIQLIDNLKEYQDIWDNYTPEEAAAADVLYYKYKPFIKK